MLPGKLLSPGKDNIEFGFKPNPVVAMEVKTIRQRLTFFFLLLFC